MIVLAWFVAALMLTPLVLYAVGKIRDPFHPLIFMGTLAYFVNVHRLLMNSHSALELLPETIFTPYLWMSALSMVGIYVGWWLGGRNRQTHRLIERAETQVQQYDISRWVIFGVIFAVIAVPVHFAQLDEDVTGWFKDLRMLWIASAILLVQFFCASAAYARSLVFIPLAAALMPPIERFLHYGQRGDTFRLAAVAALFYLGRRKRPRKAFFIAGGFGLLVILATLQMTRQMVIDGEAANRFEALASVIPKYFESANSRTDASDEYIFGAAGMAAVRETHKYGYGTGITIGFFDHLLPRFIFEEKDYGVIPHGGYDGDTIKMLTDLVIPPGSAPGGFAHGFFELGWCCWLAWLILAYIYRILWDRIHLTHDFMYDGLFIGYTMAMLYAITQDILTAEVNIMYAFLPLYLVYRFSRVESTSPAVIPALSAAPANA